MECSNKGGKNGLPGGRPNRRRLFLLGKKYIKSGKKKGSGGITLFYTEIGRGGKNARRFFTLKIFRWSLSKILGSEEGKKGTSREGHYHSM